MTLYNSLTSDLAVFEFKTTFSEEYEKEVYLITLLKLGYNLSQIKFENSSQTLKTIEDSYYYITELGDKDTTAATKIFEPLAWVLGRDFAVEIESIRLIPDLSVDLTATPEVGYVSDPASKISLETRLKDDRTPENFSFFTKCALSPLEEFLTAESPTLRRIGFLIKALGLKKRTAFDNEEVMHHAV